MADKLIANIHATFDEYTQNIRPLIARICNHAQSQDNIASLFEQVSDYLIVFEQDFEVNYYTLLKFSTDLDPLLTTFGNQYELLLKFVGLVFSLALADMTIDIDDYPVLEPLVKKMKDSKKYTYYCLDSLKVFMAGTHPQDIPPFVEDNSCQTPQNPSIPVVPQDHPTIKADHDNTLPTSNIKAEPDNSTPTPQSPSTPVVTQSYLTIKAEPDNSTPAPQNPSTPMAPQHYPTIKAEFNNSPLPSQDPTTSIPNTIINIKAEVDTDSEAMEIDTLYHPDMDTSDTSSDNDTDSNYDPDESDYSDFDDPEGDFLEARERERRAYLLAYGNIWKHIPPARHMDPLG